MTKYNRALGFDFGLRRIGVATAQFVTCSASPLMTLLAQNGTPDWIKVDQLIKEWSPDILVVGYPLNMDGSVQHIAEAAKAFSQALAKRYSKPVELFDERLTTIEARTRIFDRGGSRALKKTQIDAEAAAIILESWMTSLK